VIVISKGLPGNYNVVNENGQSESADFNRLMEILEHDLDLTIPRMCEEDADELEELRKLKAILKKVCGITL
jgi:hypothetical protein